MGIITIRIGIVSGYLHMFSFLVGFVIGCSHNQEEVYLYRPADAKKDMPLEDQRKKATVADENKDLMYRPRHMPCFATETREKNGVVYRTWNWHYSYDEKGRLQYANSIEVKDGKPVDSLSDDKLFWNSRYEYDDKDRLVRYFHLTERNLLVWWEMQYTNLQQGAQVIIIGKQEPESCLSVASPFIHSRKCFQEPVVVERLMFAFDRKGKALAGKIESKWRNVISGTKLQFENKVNNLFMGNITFFGWEFVIGQSDTLMGRAKTLLYNIDYDHEDDGAVLRIRSPSYTTRFKSGEMCEK